MCISSVLPAVEVSSWGGFPRGASAGLPGPPARPVRPARGCTALLTCPCLCFGLPFGLSFCLCFCLVFLSLFLSQFLSLSTAQCICYCNDSKLHLYKFKSSAGEEGRVNSRRDTSGSDSHESLLVKLLGDLTTVPGAVCPVDKCLPAVAPHTLGSSNP